MNTELSKSLEILLDWKIWTITFALGAMYGIALMLLFRKVVRESKLLKVGDNVRLSGKDFIIKEINGDSALIEGNSPLHMLTKKKEENKNGK